MRYFICLILVVLSSCYSSNRFVMNPNLGTAVLNAYVEDEANVPHFSDWSAAEKNNQDFLNAALTKSSDVGLLKIDKKNVSPVFDRHNFPIFGKVESKKFISKRLPRNSNKFMVGKKPMPTEIVKKNTDNRANYVTWFVFVFGLYIGLSVLLVGGIPVKSIFRAEAVITTLWVLQAFGQKNTPGDSTFAMLLAFWGGILAMILWLTLLIGL